MFRWTVSHSAHKQWLVCVCQKQAFATWNRICFERFIIAWYVLLKAIIRFISIYRLSFGSVSTAYAPSNKCLWAWNTRTSYIKRKLSNSYIKISGSIFLNGFEWIDCNPPNKSIRFCCLTKNCIRWTLHPLIEEWNLYPFGVMEIYTDFQRNPYWSSLLWWNIFSPCFEHKTFQKRKKLQRSSSSNQYEQLRKYRLF